MKPEAYSIIVPVRNEEAVLPQTVPALMAAAAGDLAEIVYVCNGCGDRSAEVIRSIAGASVRVIELPTASKVRALDAGDRAAKRFPRFYVDADALLRPGDFARMASVLTANKADLVAPRQAFDMTKATGAAQRLAEIWLSLPHVKGSAFQAAIGLSAAGRSRWGNFPDVLGDDIFIAAMIPRERRAIIDEAYVTTPCPPSLSAWLRARMRWRRGERMLVSMGLPLPNAPRQRRELLRLLASSQTILPAACYVAVRLVADILSRWPARRSSAWTPDR